MTTGCHISNDFTLSYIEGQHISTPICLYAIVNKIKQTILDESLLPKEKFQQFLILLPSTVDSRIVGNLIVKRKCSNS